ncbi:MAG: metal-dependent hydrolase [Cyanobacteria bacterium RM1_2_2]|nr:metal-dependent hydrolase [Cyanobacteria bacterium RM1_2_2]
MQLLKLLAFTVSAPLVLLAIFFFWASAGSYSKAQYNEIVTYQASSEASSQDAFTVITYNIGYLSGLANAASTQQAVEPSPQLFEGNFTTAVTALKPANPDFVGLQEIDIAAKRSYNVNQVTELSKALGFRAAAIGINWDKNYVPFPFLPIKNHFARTVAAQAILSRYPITRSERIVLEPVRSQSFFYRAFYLDRVAQVAEIDLNGIPLILINVHLEAFDEPTRLNQTQVVKDLAERYAADYPVLLIGDFNSSLTRTTETNPTINLLLESTRLESAVNIEQLQNKSALTFPSNMPDDTLDYIFYTPNRIEPLEVQVVQQAAQASDHLPLMMKFRLR